MTRTGTSRSLHIFPGQTAPWPPCPQDNEDEEMKVYHLEARDTPPLAATEPGAERRQSFKGQAVRKSGTVATLHGAPDCQGAQGPPAQPQSTPLERTEIDREQI